MLLSVRNDKHRSCIYHANNTLEVNYDWKSVHHSHLEASSVVGVCIRDRISRYTIKPLRSFWWKQMNCVHLCSPSQTWTGPGANPPLEFTSRSRRAYNLCFNWASINYRPRYILWAKNILIQQTLFLPKCLRPIAV